MFKRYRTLLVVMIVLVIFHLLHLQIKYNDTIPTSFNGSVTSISENYYTVKLDNASVILYSDTKLMYADEVHFKGHYKEISSTSNSKAFNFKRYMQRQNIHYSIKPYTLSVTKSNYDFRNVILNRTSLLSNSAYYNKVLLNISSYNNQSVSDLLLSSRIIIVLIIGSIFKFLDKFYYDDYFYVLKVIIYSILLLVFKNYEFYTYLIIRTILNNLKMKTFDKTFISATLVLILFPHYLFSLSFIIIFLFQLSNIVSLNKSKISSLLIMIPVILNTNYEVDILQVITFPLIKFYNGILYIFAYIDLIFKSSISYKLSTFLSIFKSSLTITGSMPIIVLIIWGLISLSVMKKVKISNVILLCLVLFINQNQLLFSPFLTYTQIYIGQGDSSIITYPFRSKVLMIDTGSNFNEAKLKSYLDYYGIKTITNLIISHDDEDHNGNEVFLLNNYDVENINKSAEKVYFYKLIVNNIQYTADNDNDSSLITTFSVNNYNYLLLGDVSKDIEARFLDDYVYDYDIVKLAHHGSNTSTTIKLLENPNIKLLLNSSGLNNMYNHPHIDILRLINDYDHILLDTQEFGDIKIKHLLNLSYVSLSK